MYDSDRIVSLKQYKISWVIKILIIADVIIWSARNLITPLFSIFIIMNLGAGLEVVGIASAILLITQYVFEAPVAFFIDKIKSERNDLFISILGSIGMGLGYILFIYVTEVWHVYVLHVFIGLSMSIIYPGMVALFTSHIDKGLKAFEWSLQDSLLGLGMAGAAAVGGFMVDKWGFNPVFVLVGCLQITGGILLLTLEKSVNK